MSVYKKYGIYGIRNKINNKIYIGKTVNNFGDRWDCHKAQLRGGYNGNPPLQDDWNKYHEENFEFIIIYDCLNNEDLETVNNLEKAEIKKYKDLGLAYNLHDGGDEGYFLGKHLSEETKRKIGEKNRVNMLGKKATEETKKKMSETHKKRYADWTEEDRIKYGQMISKRMTGIKKPKLHEIMKNNKNGAKYTVEQVKEMRRLYECEHKTVREISRIFNVPYGTVGGIVKYRRWKEIV